MTELLSQSAQSALLDPLYETGWTLEGEGDKLVKEFKFDDFTAAFAFMTRAAMWAEKWDHHPDWSNSYNRVKVALTTHDMGGVTTLDAKLARKMDQLTG